MGLPRGWNSFQWASRRLILALSERLTLIFPGCLVVVVVVIGARERSEYVDGLGVVVADDRREEQLRRVG